MLTKNPDLIHIRGQVTDLSGRTFTNISGFEYALWALDKHMWTKMLGCLPHNKEGKKIKDILYDQYQKMKTRGVTYTLKGVTTTERHFDFENTIINELQTQVNTMDDKQWIQGVGGALRVLPMHAIDEYCSDEPFHPEPTFEKQPLKLSRKFYNWRTEEYESWFNNKIGDELAIYKGRWSRWACGGRLRLKMDVECDLATMRKLCLVRSNDFTKLEDELNQGRFLDSQCNFNTHGFGGKFL